MSVADPWGYVALYPDQIRRLLLTREGFSEFARQGPRSVFRADRREIGSDVVKVVYGPYLKVAVTLWQPGKLKNTFSKTIIKIWRHPDVQRLQPGACLCLRS